MTEIGWERLCRRYVVSGRVQGVGYRAFAARAAHSLRLSGAARNLDDGRVEVLALGPEHALSRFEGALHEGSRHARVDHVDVEALETLPSTDEFDVDF